jgi:serine/threonine protein kinase
LFEEILFVAEGVRRALEFAHGKLWFHLDVRPSNIVIEFDNNGNTMRAVLIDWGIASNQEVTGFQGSKLYAHDDIFTQKTTESWIPEAKHDYASLFYTLVVMQGKGHVPWGSYCNTKADDLAVYVAKRRKIAIAVCNACAPLVKGEMKKKRKKIEC